MINSLTPYNRVLTVPQTDNTATRDHNNSDANHHHYQQREQQRQQQWIMAITGVRTSIDEHGEVGSISH